MLDRAKYRLRDAFGNSDENYLDSSISKGPLFPKDFIVEANGTHHDLTSVSTSWSTFLFVVIIPISRIPVLKKRVIPLFRTWSQHYIAPGVIETGACIPKRRLDCDK